MARFSLFILIRRSTRLAGLQNHAADPSIVGERLNCLAETPASQLFGLLGVTCQQNFEASPRTADDREPLSCLGRRTDNRIGTVTGESLWRVRFSETDQLDVVAGKRKSLLDGAIER